jgi:hypothetical protein
MEIQKKAKDYAPYIPGLVKLTENNNNYSRINEQLTTISDQGNNENNDNYSNVDYWEVMEENDRALKSMVIGFIICLIGVIPTIVTYFSASSEGTYYVFWGAILFGGIKGLIGLMKLLKYRGIR